MKNTNKIENHETAKTSSAANVRRKYARYPNILTGYNLDELIEIARQNGMKIITGYKPEMHVCAEIGLYGTSVQMKKTDTDWENGGTTIVTARSGLVFGVNLNVPRNEWIDA